MALGLGLLRTGFVDSTAILACMQYVDLNPLRANMAVSPELGDITSAQNPIVDLQATDVSTAEGRNNLIEHKERAGWLSTFRSLRAAPLRSRDIASQ